MNKSIANQSWNMKCQLADLLESGIDPIQWSNNT